MLNDNALGDRLNAVKDGKPIPDPPNPDVPVIPQIPQQIQLTIKQWAINESYKLFSTMLTSTFYGFGIAAIFSTDWTIMETIGVGVIVNHSLVNILNIIPKLFKSKS